MNPTIGTLCFAFKSRQYAINIPAAIWNKPHFTWSAALKAKISSVFFFFCQNFFRWKHWPQKQRRFVLITSRKHFEISSMPVSNSYWEELMNVEEVVFLAATSSIPIYNSCNKLHTTTPPRRKKSQVTVRNCFPSNGLHPEVPRDSVL